MTGQWRTPRYLSLRVPDYYNRSKSETSLNNLLEFNIEILRKTDKDEESYSLIASYF